MMPCHFHLIMPSNKDHGMLCHHKISFIGINGGMHSSNYMKDGETKIGLITVREGFDL